MDRTRARKKSWVKYAILGIALMLITAVVGIAISETWTCSYLHGTCGYDPRTQKPLASFIAIPPEQFAVQYIQNQIKQNGTFPMTATSTVSSVTPIWVSAGGFYTDWHAKARTQVQIEYANAQKSIYTFEVFEKMSRMVLGVENTTMFVEYGPFTDCDVSSLGLWECQ